VKDKKDINAALKEAWAVSGSPLIQVKDLKKSLAVLPFLNGRRFVREKDERTGIASGRGYRGWTPPAYHSTERVDRW
jgi:hypothetical protein